MYEEIISVRDSSFLLWVWFSELDIKVTKIWAKGCTKNVPQQRNLLSR